MSFPTLPFPTLLKGMCFPTIHTWGNLITSTVYYCLLAGYLILMLCCLILPTLSLLYSISLVVQLVV